MHAVLSFLQWIFYAEDWFCEVIFSKPTIEKAKWNNTEQKNLYYENIIIEVLNKEDKNK